MTPLPKCARPDCARRVSEYRRKFCSPECGQQAASQPTRPHSRHQHDTTPCESFRVDGQTAVATRLTRQPVKTLADLVRICEIDLTEWDVDRWEANVWEMGSKDANGVAHATPLFQVKAWLKRKVAVIAVREEIASLFAHAARALPHRVRRRPQPGGNHPYLLEVSIPDLHAGKLAWGAETGHADYDIKVAERVFEEALETLIARVPAHPYRQVVFVAGNDLLNADNTTGTTTRGTPVENDSRFQKTFVTVRKMMVRAIDRLRLIAPVHVPMVPGNHDFESLFSLGDSLECYFHKVDDVVVDNAPTLRKYIQFGRVMLMFTHGNQGKLPDYPLVMATEQPVMFGATTHREAHTGHIHRLRMEEYHGVKVRTSPALCPPDAWHSAHQFVGQGRSAEAFIWHEQDGLVGTAYYTVPT